MDVYFFFFVKLQNYSQLKHKTFQRLSYLNNLYVKFVKFYYASHTFKCCLKAFGKNEIVPSFQEKEEVQIQDARLTEHQTSPPDYLTEAEVITLMEKHGIGTDASIPVHINNICQRNYVTVSSGRRLVPTTLGIVLVHGYQKVDDLYSLFHNYQLIHRLKERGNI